MHRRVFLPLLSTFAFGQYEESKGDVPWVPTPDEVMDTMFRMAKLKDAQLQTLRKDYAIVDSDRNVMDLLEEHATLFPLLVQAVQPLKSAFGERLFQIRVQHSGYDKLLKIVVRIPGHFDEPETALRSFDANWWINNCQRSSGALVFDYEIQNAV